MTFSDYFRELGIAAFFSAARRIVDNRNDWRESSDIAHTNLKAEQAGRREDQQVFLDRILAKNQVSTLYEPSLPPLKLPLPERTPFEVMNDGQRIVDQEAADYQRLYEEQSRNAYPPAVQVAAERLRAQ